jgi:hypothetical protein
VKTFFGQLLLDIDPEHVDADTGERAAPTVGDK